MKFYDSENHWNNFDDQVPPGLHVGTKMAAVASISKTRKKLANLAILIILFIHLTPNFEVFKFYDNENF